jgi:hypothetical protein
VSTRMYLLLLDMPEDANDDVDEEAKGEGQFAANGDDANGTDVHGDDAGADVSGAN